MSQRTVSAIAMIACVALGLFVGFVATNFAISRFTNKYQGKEFITAAERERQLKCLALNVYHEAGIEPFEGKVAVAQVTINRSNSPHFPKDICRVVYQKDTFVSKTVCQFSWYCLQPSKLAPVNTKSYEESYIVAKKVLLEDFRLSSIESALFYHADYVNPGWNKKRITKIGKHIFYE
jgi:spore germination cell wall hydrolase CwlJ-like protein